MNPYTRARVVETMPSFWGQDGSDILTNALRRIYATNDRLLALQIGLQEIVQLTAAQRGILLVKSPDGDDEYPIFMYGGGLAQPYKFAASDVLVNRWVLSLSQADLASFPIRLPLKDFGAEVGAIHLDVINQVGPWAEQRRIAVDTILPQLALIVAFVVENSELLRVGRERQTLLEMLTTTGQISQRLNANADVDRILAEFKEACHFLLDASHCSILMVDWDSETMRFLEGNPFGEMGGEAQEMGLHDSIAGAVARTGEPALVPEARFDPRFNEKIDTIDNIEAHQLMCVPLSVRGRILGVVEAINKASGDFDELDLSVMQLLATNVAIALENARHVVQHQAEVKQKAELHSVASHGLRSPLMSILTSVDWILATGVQNEAHKARLEDIRGQTFSLSRFASEILDMSRIDMGNIRMDLTPVAIVPIIRKILAAFELRISTHRFEIQTKGTIPPVRADESQLAIILDHLIENAVKYSPEGRVVRVEVDKLDDQVRVSVCDQGNGIPPDELGHIFTRFYRGQEQSSSKGHSLGLGLFITQKLVEAQQGNIWVESEVDCGSRFMFTLPQEQIGN